MNSIRLIPLVDLYNSVSMAYALPCGGEDMDKLVGGPLTRQAKGGEPFFPLGADEDAPALEGEIIYYDQEGAVCRCLNWRGGSKNHANRRYQGRYFGD